MHGGDRLPWVPFDGSDNFEPLPRPGWQVHVYGLLRPEMAAWCARHGVALRHYLWREAFGAAGLARDACYLLRADTYVGLAAGTPAPALLDAYHADAKDTSRRMKAMRKTVVRRDVSAWATSFLEGLAAVEPHQKHPRAT